MAFVTAARGTVGGGRRRLRPACSHSGVGEGIAATYRHFRKKEDGLAHPNLYRLMFGGRCSPDAIREARGTAPSNSPYNLLREALEMLADEGAMRPAAREGGTELVAWAQVHGFVALIIDGRGGMNGRAQVARRLGRHLDVFVGGFSSP